MTVADFLPFPLVPKLRLGTRLSVQFYCLGNRDPHAIGITVKIGNGVASARVFPNRVWEQAAKNSATVIDRRYIKS
jgi:hypothetical protein